METNKSPEQIKYFFQEEIKSRLNKDICCYRSFQNISVQVKIQKKKMHFFICVGLKLGLFHSAVTGRSRGLSKILGPNE